MKPVAALLVTLATLTLGAQCAPAHDAPQRTTLKLAPDYYEQDDE
jgi:hypothetical protein